METRRHGADRHGDMRTWRHGDMETWRFRDMETYNQRGDIKRKAEAQISFLHPCTACSLCKRKFFFALCSQRNKQKLFCPVFLILGKKVHFISSPPLPFNFRAPPMYYTVCKWPKQNCTVSK
jgi:hypothetical protein